MNDKSILEMDFSVVEKQMDQWRQDRNVKRAFWRFYQYYILRLYTIYRNENNFVEKLRLKKKMYTFEIEKRKYEVDSILCMDSYNGKKIC